MKFKLKQFLVQVFILESSILLFFSYIIKISYGNQNLGQQLWVLKVKPKLVLKLVFMFFGNM